jgi:hypothetical protein
MSTNLFNYLNKYKASQFVFTDILIYEPTYYLRPSQYVKYTLFVFDTQSKKLFYYNNRYECNGRALNFKDEDYSFQNLNNLHILKQMLTNYKRHLKPYIKYKPN